MKYFKLFCLLIGFFCLVSNDAFAQEPEKKSSYSKLKSRSAEVDINEQINISQRIPGKHNVIVVPGYTGAKKAGA